MLDRLNPHERHEHSSSIPFSAAEEAQTAAVVAAGVEVPADGIAVVPEEVHMAPAAAAVAEEVRIYFAEAAASAGNHRVAAVDAAEEASCLLAVVDTFPAVVPAAVVEGHPSSASYHLAKACPSAVAEAVAVPYPAEAAEEGPYL